MTTIRVDFNAMKVAADNLKARSVAFQQEIDKADLAARPMKQTWVDTGSEAGLSYQERWDRIAKEIAALSTTIENLSNKVSEAGMRQFEQEKRLANKFAG